MPTLLEIKGVGPALAKACVENGYTSVEKIATAVVGEFVAVPGVSAVRARQLIEAATSLLNKATAPTDIASAEGNPEKQQEQKNNKKNRKDKKKNKKRNSNKKKDKKAKKNKKKSKKK